ncbi:cyclic GMP-AMP synthase, partial [Mytilus galloprovincialis]
MRGSDLDVMVVQKWFDVCEELKSLHHDPTKIHLLMERDDVKPCYTLLRLVYSRSSKDMRDCDEHNGKQYLSSAWYKQSLVNDKHEIHGPCLSDKEGEVDIAACLHCKTWIAPAIQWVSRSRNSWPSHKVKQSIIDHGVLFVPIGAKGSQKENLEWRVSFSVGEKFLINTFTHTQLLCYALLKIILKDVIDIHSECKDLLSSYFLKTIMFWISGDLPQSIWKPDSINPNTSIALYRYLCQHIVGTEDHVKQVRLMNAVRDNMQNFKNVTIITSGSFGEGLEMRGSDFDIMIVLKQFDVCEELKSHYHPNKIQLLIERDDVKPCYTLLRLVYSRSSEVMRACDEHNGKQYLSSALHKQGLVNDELGTIHGPCFSNKKETIDLASCLHCKTWISPAIQWVSRSSNSWPSHEVKQSIVDHGVLFVPIGAKGSQKENLEWRVSFSVGEKFLINTFTHTQLLCYALLKIVLKDVLAIHSECKDLLCSYFLKTIMFWISEELPLSIWKPNNLIPCFMRCYKRLIYCVEHSVCLHYFIPENNLFENKIEGRSREILLEKLSTLHSYGWQCVLFSDQISNFHVSMWNFQLEPHILYVDDVNQ